MARLFTISVPFKDKLYTALISIRECGHDMSCQVRYIDKELTYLLPGDQIIFSLQEGLKQPKNLPNELAESLLVCTTNALTEHLSVS